MNYKWLRVSVIVMAALVIVYYLGPRPSTPVYDVRLPEVPQEADALEQYVQAGESLHKLKPGNNARIIWYDSARKKTTYSVVYLHGFSASQQEGAPVHLDFARSFGCNLYLSRLDGHGIDTSEPLLTMTARGLWADARRALAIGKALGDKVILMGTSTGGTLALKLAATYPNDVFAVINLSPNIAINDRMAFLANNPWGLHLARLVKGGRYNESTPENPEITKYWYSKYRLEAVAELESLLETTMTPATFRKVHQPVLTLYYYKDEEHQDPTVKVSAILEMEKQLGTPDSLKRLISIPNAGAHVLGSDLTSKDVPAVEKAINEFARRQLKMRKKG